MREEGRKKTLLEGDSTIKNKACFSTLKNLKLVTGSVRNFPEENTTKKSTHQQEITLNM